MRTILITAITVTFVLSCKNKKETENSMSTNDNKTPKIDNTDFKKVNVRPNAKNQNNLSRKINVLQYGQWVKLQAKFIGSTLGVHSTSIASHQ